MKKPVVAYIAGLSAPKGRRMGHAGAIISAFGESAPEKVEILKGCGVTIAPTPSEMGSTMQKVLSPRGRRISGASRLATSMAWAGLKSTRQLHDAPAGPILCSNCRTRRRKRAVVPVVSGGQRRGARH